MLGTAPNMQIEENLALALRRGKKRTLKWGGDENKSARITMTGCTRWGWGWKSA